jgi:hypothetical protein
MPQLVYGVFGVVFGIRCDSPAILEEFRRTQLPPDWRPSPDGKPDHWLTLEKNQVYWNGERIGAGPDREWLLRTAGNRLHLCLGEFSNPRVFLHASVVSLEGQAVIMPGRSYAGKSSLALELARLPGASLYSDDFAVLQDLNVVPYAIPLSLRQEEGPPQLIEARDLGWNGLAQPVPLALGILATYQARAVWNPKRLTPGEASLQLLEHTLSALRSAERTFAVVTQLAARVPCYQGQRGEARELVPWILERLSRKP